MHRPCHLLVAVLVAAAFEALATSPARALHAGNGPDVGAPAGALPGGLSVRGSTGLLDGDANRWEYTADESGYPVATSDSDWDMRLIWMVGLEATAGLSDRIRVNAGFWKGISRGAGKMSEQRWLWSGHDWSHEQRGAVDVIGSSVFDCNAAVDLVSWEGIVFSGLAGWRRDAWAWTDRAQSFTESNDGFRDTEGEHGGQNTMTYSQVFSAPYVGVDGRAAFGPAGIELYALLSSLSAARDAIHYRNRELDKFPGGIHSENSSSSGPYICLGGRGVFNITDSLFAGARLDIQSHPSRTAERRTRETGEIFGNGAAISQSAVMLSALVGWRL